jgi:hypothetical protein
MSEYLLYQPQANDGYEDLGEWRLTPERLVRADCFVTPPSTIVRA